MTETKHSGSKNTRIKRIIIRVLLEHPKGLDRRIIHEAITPFFRRTPNNTSNHLRDFQDWSVVEEFSKGRRTLYRIPKKYFRSDEKRLEFLSIVSNRLKINDRSHREGICVLLSNNDYLKGHGLYLKYVRPSLVRRGYTWGKNSNYLNWEERYWKEIYLQDILKIGMSRIRNKKDFEGLKELIHRFEMRVLTLPRTPRDEYYFYTRTAKELKEALIYAEKQIYPKPEKERVKDLWEDFIKK